MWFAVTPTYSREMGYGKNVFGPYYTEPDAQGVVDKLEVPSEIVELSVNTLNEAITLLNRIKWEPEGGW